MKLLPSEYLKAYSVTLKASEVVIKKIHYSLLFVSFYLPVYIKFLLILTLQVDAYKWIKFNLDLTDWLPEIICRVNRQHKCRIFSTLGCKVRENIKVISLSVVKIDSLENELNSIQQKFVEVQQFALHCDVWVARNHKSNSWWFSLGNGTQLWKERYSGVMEIIGL